jgi:hypothetical protein
MKLVVLYVGMTIQFYNGCVWTEDVAMDTTPQAVSATLVVFMAVAVQDMARAQHIRTVIAFAHRALSTGISNTKR